MEHTIEEIKRHYQENLNPADFHKLKQEELQYMRDVHVFSLTALYEILSKGKFKGNKLLEIGSGPTVHNIASAAAHFTEIVQSDFVEANCEELRKWLSGNSQLDWSPFIEVVAKVEGYEDFNLGRQEIEARIRRSVKSVIRCDVLSDQVVPEDETMEYDVIVTSLTLESAATDFECFLAILRRLNRLLRTGGGLVMTGFLNGDRWRTAGGEFHYLQVTQSDIDKALDIAGFREIEWTILPKEKDIPEFKYEHYYVVSAVKYMNLPQLSINMF